MSSGEQGRTLRFSSRILRLLIDQHRSLLAWMIERSIQESADRQKFTNARLERRSKTIVSAARLLGWDQTIKLEES